MTNTALIQWSFGTTRIATNSPRALGDDNYMTSDDAVRFLVKLAHHDILGDARGTALQGWLALSPNTGIGGWLVARLPADVQASVEHKAGWLPPGCCSDDRYYNTLNEIGIVSVVHGRPANVLRSPGQLVDAVVRWAGGVDSPHAATRSRSKVFISVLILRRTGTIDLAPTESPTRYHSRINRIFRCRWGTQL